MAMHVLIPDELVAHLEKQAEAVGSVPEQIAVAAIRRQIQADEQLDQVLAPVREAYEASGMTEEELSDVLEKAKHDMRAERRSRKTQ